VVQSDGLQAKIAESLFTAVISLQRAKLFAERDRKFELAFDIGTVLLRIESCEKSNSTTRKEVNTNG